jgi:nucleotide-binding universal stress UspA family protein
MADAVGGRVEVVTVVDRLADVALARDELRRGIDELGPLDHEPVELVQAGHTVVGVLTRHLEGSQGGMAVMSSHGHGRSAAVLGSTTEELLRSMFGPVIVIGPRVRADAGRLDGNYVVPLDGSSRADGVLPIVAAWSVEFGGTPWLVEVVDDSGLGSGDALESSMVSRRATDLRGRIDRAVEFEVLHGDHAARSIVEFADDRDASLIFMATHGRTGLERLRCGSVAADVVRTAHCPVVMFRPPQLVVGRSLVGADATTG